MGVSELLIVLFVAVLIFGAGRIPQIGDALGRSILNFKKALKGQNEIDVTPKKPKEPLRPGTGERHE
jgi:sec-independent protein translocase protein TatA